MELDICFICGVKIGRGNRSEVGPQEKMEKLVSVSNTVEHSSTIISDILSRILNETVLREESVCRICFNLLNDIDYHLKEAQEKTDEITAKFLDKEKDPLQYQPSNLVDPRTREPPGAKRRMFGKLVTTSGGRPGGKHAKSLEQDPIEVEDPPFKYIGLGGDRDGKSSYQQQPQGSPRRVATKNIQLVPVKVMPRVRQRQAVADSEVGASSADEMTVNALAEKKRRLISRVLAPNKRSKHEVREEEDDNEDYEDYYLDDTPVYEELTIDTGKDRYENENSRETDRAKRKKEKKRRKKEKEKERRMRVLQLEREKRDKEDNRRNELVLRPYVSEDESEEEERKENTSPKKTKEIRTVDLQQLGDLFSKSPEKEEKYSTQVLARKTVPTPAARKQMDFSSGHTFYIYPAPFSSDRTDGDQLTIGEVIAEAEPSGNIIVKQDQISLKIQDVSDESESEYTPQYTPVKNTSTTSSSLQADRDLNPSYPPGVKPGSSPSIACPHCDKKFMRGYNMRVHIDRVHNKNKPWLCQFCEKHFATTSDLKQHMSSHGMGKIHKCADCGRQFNNRDSAILHRKQHNNERTHVCIECGKGFFKASCLTRHMRCHTGEKPFQCDFCDRKFSQVTTLKHHRKVCKYLPPEPLHPEINKMVFPEPKIEVDPHRKLNISF